MPNINNINGFPVIVFNGKEITANQLEQLGEADREKVQHKVNGPHYESKWVKHLKERGKVPTLATA